MYAAELPKAEAKGGHGTSGFALLHNPALNRGLAFTAKEREAHGLLGLLPPAVFTLDLLLEQARWQFERMQRPLDKYCYLMAMQVWPRAHDASQVAPDVTSSMADVSEGIAHVMQGTVDEA